ncbi:MAG TPA: hypothetical protein DDY37_00005, partial [Legionella sp.]|nr:hypothetical protein [Legionella sp.]
RVVFLAIHKSVWKVDPVFKKMLADPYFDPIILVCPYTSFGDERMWEDLQLSLDYFSEKGYPTYSSYVETKDRWLALDELKPDIVFFTNPHNLTRREYYEDAYLNYLSCYVPYHHEVGSYGNNSAQYDQPFHNAMWRIYATHNDSYEIFKTLSKARGRNVLTTGYPAMEEILRKRKINDFNDVWKSKDSRCRIIWAPHHTIDSIELPYSNFLTCAEDFRKLAINKSSDLVWAFKPHPLLKSRLYNHSSWGKEKTDLYYSFWEESSFTQLELGEYEDLFLSSNSMIHDCGSFLAEYLYLEKPVAYLISSKNSEHYYSGFGKRALNACQLAYDFRDVEKFVDGLIKKNDFATKEKIKFYENDIMPFFREKIPSEIIIRDIRMHVNEANTWQQ